MPIEPLFVADMDTLKGRLRLSAVGADDTGAQIDKALEDVRLGFFDSLGEDRVLEIRAITFLENALTAADLVRTKANNLEVLWVRMLLMRRLPMIFMDASGNSADIWQEEPARRLSGRDLRDEIKRIQQEIEDGLADLGGDPEDQGPLQADVLEPDPSTVLSPRYSIRPILGY